jgi:hypothetical protein
MNSKLHPKWLRCDDGSYIQVRHITRLFVQEDIVADCAWICASIPGPAHPFKIAQFRESDYSAHNNAVFWLNDLIDRLET